MVVPLGDARDPVRAPALRRGAREHPPLDRPRDLGRGPVPAGDAPDPDPRRRARAHRRHHQPRRHPQHPDGLPHAGLGHARGARARGLVPLFVNAGLAERPTVPCLDVYGAPGQDPRFGPAVPDAERLVEAGRADRPPPLLPLGPPRPRRVRPRRHHDRALRAPRARPPGPDLVELRGEPDRAEGGRRPERARAARPPRPALARTTSSARPATPCSRSRRGSRRRTTGTLLLAGGTQQLAVAAVLHALGKPVPRVVTTSYVRDDASANFAELAARVGADPLYVDPGFGELGHAGLARYCAGRGQGGDGRGRRARPRRAPRPQPRRDPRGRARDGEGLQLKTYLFKRRT